MCKRGWANRARNMCCGRHKSSIRNRWYLLKQPGRLVPGQVCRPHGSCCPCKYSTVPPLSTKIQWLHALNSCVQAGKGYTAATRLCMRADEFRIRESAFHSLMSLRASRGQTPLDQDRFISVRHGNCCSIRRACRTCATGFCSLPPRLVESC